MNAKICKRARALARSLTQGQPAYRLMTSRVARSTVINHPESTRGIYRTLKKGIRSGMTLGQIALKGGI